VGVGLEEEAAADAMVVAVAVMAEGISVPAEVMAAVALVAAEVAAHREPPTEVMAPMGGSCTQWSFAQKCKKG